MNNNYFLSIIVCCYNSEKYIENTIKSILDSIDSNFQVILIDDGSTDQTLNLLNNYNKFNNFKIITQKNRGLSASRNLAINESNSDWITIIDHDDLFTKDRIKIFKNVIKNNKINEFFFGNAIIKENHKNSNKFKENNKNPKEFNLKKQYCYYELLTRGCFIISSTVLFKKSLYNKLDGFNNNLKITCDYDFFIRASRITDIIYIDNLLCYWRKHISQTTSVKQLLHYQELVYIYKNELKRLNIIRYDTLLIIIKLIKFNIKLLYLKLFK